MTDYDLFTAESIAAHMAGAVTCVRCKMMYVPGRSVSFCELQAIKCPFCTIFGDARGPVELQPIRALP